MHIAYSAIQDTKGHHNCKMTDRYRGYLAACKKHQQTITAIQEYLPGWKPPFTIGSTQFSAGSMQGIAMNHEL